MTKSYFTNKPDAMRKVLDKENVRYRERTGWQSVRCPNRDAHTHGDKNPSASVNLAKGAFKCQGCDLHGDAFDLGLLLYGVGPADLLGRLDMEAGRVVVEPEWIT